MAREPNEFDEVFVPVGIVSGPLPRDVGLSEPRYFPSPTATTDEGLLCIGGRLSPDWLLDAYRHGIFPWPTWKDAPIPWCSPDPRAVIELDGLHVSRRLRRTLRGGTFHATCDRDFEGVIRGCATENERVDATWITPQMIEAYCQMHALGRAHSVETWRGERLVGGVYGIAIGGLFVAESMFYRERDASKVALVYLVAHLRARGYGLLDVQQWTPHTGRMGAIEIPRIDYLRRLARLRDLPITFGEWLEGQP